MKKLILASLALTLSACGEIHDYELERLEAICKSKRGIKSMWFDANLVRAQCKNGDLVTVNDDVLSVTGEK